MPHCLDAVVRHRSSGSRGRPGTGPPSTWSRRRRRTKRSARRGGGPESTSATARTPRRPGRRASGFFRCPFPMLLVLPRIRSDDCPGSLQDAVDATLRVTQAGGAIDTGRRAGARVAHRRLRRSRGGRARRGGGRLVPGRAAAAALDDQFKYRLRPRPRPRRGRPQESFDSCGPAGRPREDARQHVHAQGPERNSDAFRGYVLGAQPRAPGRAPVVRRLARREGGPRLLRRAARRLSHGRRRSIE